MEFSKFFIFIILAIPVCIQSANDCDLDLSFVVTACPFDGNSNFNKSVDFIKTVIDNFVISPDRTRVSLITACYSSRRRDFGFNEWPGYYLYNLNWYLNNMKKPKGSYVQATHLDYALNLAREVFTPSYGERTNKSNVLVVLLDRGHDGISYFKNSAKSLHNNVTDLKVFAVGIGTETAIDNLNIIANNKSSNVFHEVDLSLNSTAKYVSFMACSDFLPFGKEFGDDYGNAGDDVATCFNSSFSQEFPLFFTKNHSRVCISSNGYITVDKHVSRVAASLTSDYTVLVPFNHDMRSLGNDTFFRATKNKTILKMIDEDIAQKHSREFRSKEAIVITFNNLQYYRNSNLTYNYQAILATDYDKVYAIFHYERMDTRGKNNIGFNEPSTTDSCNTTLIFNLNENNLTTSSNIDKPGKFVFLLESPECLYCPHGFRTVNASCQKVDEFIMIVDGNEIIFFDAKLDDEAVPPSQPILNLQYSVAIDFDYESRMIYYSDGIEGTISRVDIYGNNKIVMANETYCDGLAWDWVNKRLYWTDYIEKTVNRLSRDGYSKEVLFHEEADLPRDIVLMPCDGYMYWRVWQGTKSSIKHATMDGLNPKIIIETVGWPNGLAVDKDENRLFWADTRPNRIESSDLDGNNRKIILQADNLYILAISLYNNYIYFTDLVTKSLMRVEKKGNGHQELLDGGLNRYPKGIRIFSKSKQNCTRTLCHKDITRCTDICMPSNNLVHCSCPINKTLTDGYRCIQTAKAGLNCSDTMTSFICYDESKCISKASICDGYYDCFDGSDERNCTSQSTIFPSTSLSLSYQTSLPTSTVFKPSKSTMEFSLKTSSAIHQSTADKDSSATLYSSSISPSTSTMTSSSSSVTTSNHSATLHSSSINPSTSTMTSSSSSVTTSNHSSATLHSSSISPSTSTMTSSSSSVTTSNHSATLHSSSISPSTSTMASSSSSVTTSKHSSATLHSSVTTSNHSATLHSSSISPSTSTMASSSSSVTTSNHSATLHSSSISPSTSTMTSSSSSVTTIRTTPASNASACDLDLGFVIDESGSISFDDFRKSIDFVRNITQYFTIATARTRVSLITYGTDAVLHFKFNDDAGSDQSTFLDYISTINGRGGNTNTYAALKMSNLEMFNTENGDRTDKVNVLIVLTDGRSSGRSQLISESNALRESGVKVLAVGVGSGVGEEELNIIAGNSLNVFNVYDASHLGDIIEEIIPISCNEQMLELECQSYGFKAGFSLSGLQSKNLPYTIRFSGSNDCGTINKTSSDHLSNGRIWMWTNYTSCGVEAYHVGDSIAFEKTLMVNYGSKDHSSVVYRYISSSYKVKCFLDRKVVQKLEINVQDVIESNPDINGTSDFKFDLKILDANNEGNEVQLANVGDRLKFVLNLENAPNQVKASPQNCYATKPDGSGRYNLISNRCVDPNEETTFITSPSNELHYFSWELLAFRYFGESNSVVIVCEVLICKNEPFWKLSEKCKRCDQTTNRKRRDVDVDDEVLQKTTVSSQPLFIIKGSMKEPGQSNQQNGFLAKPEGMSILVVLAVVVLLSGIVHLKKKFWPSHKAMSKKTLNVGAVDEKGCENLAME